jgi:hypothetical protein
LPRVTVLGFTVLGSGGAARFRLGTDMAIIIICLAIALLLVPALVAFFVLRGVVKAARTLSNYNG